MRAGYIGLAMGPNRRTSVISAKSYFLGPGDSYTRSKKSGSVYKCFSIFINSVLITLDIPCKII